HTTMRRALDVAVQWGAVPRNVARAVDPPKVPRKEIAPPTSEQGGHLLDTGGQAGDRLAALWTVAVYAGFRRGELVGVRWEAAAGGGLRRSGRTQDLRHAAATVMPAAGGRPNIASQRLGHSSVQIPLDLYTHAVKGLDADAAQRMQAAIRPARATGTG